MKYIIVLGIQNSGSGAVHDYLASRVDCESPFGMNEFKLCADPMGLHNLYLNFYENYSFLNPANARYDFLNYTNKLQDHFVYASKGVRKKLYNKNFDILSQQFIDKVTKLKFYGRPEFSNFKINKFEHYLLKIKKKRYSFFPIIIPQKKEKHMDDPTGKSTYTATFFTLDSGGRGSVTCYDWYGDTGFDKSISVSIQSKTVSNWVDSNFGVD